MRTTATNTMRRTRSSSRVAPNPLRINGRWAAVKADLQEQFVALARVDLIYRIGEEESLITAVKNALGVRRQDAIDIINRTADEARLADAIAEPPDDEPDEEPADDADPDADPFDTGDDFIEPLRRPTRFDD